MNARSCFLSRWSNRGFLSSRYDEPMRISLLLAVVATAVTLPAQGTSDFSIFPARDGANSVSFTTRSDALWAQAGEMLLHVPGDMFLGVGDTDSTGVGTCAALAFWQAGQDQNPSTQETYYIIVRNHDPNTGMPDPTTAGLVARIGPLQMPTLPQTTPASWTVTDNFAQPILLPCQGGFHFGLELAAAPGWTATDGHSVWTAWYDPSAGNVTLGDHPRAGAPELAFSIVAGSSTPLPGTRPSAGGATYQMGLWTTGPSLNVGGIDPASAAQNPVGTSCYGAGGMYPDVSGVFRSDGLDLRIHDTVNSGGTAFALLSPGPSPFGPAPVPGVIGNLWVNASVLLTVGQSTLNSNGVATIPVLAPSTVPTSLVGTTLFFQGLTVSAALANLTFTNAAGVSF